MNISEIRKQYPQYSDLSDTELADGFHKKFYADIPKDKFYSTIGIKKSETPMWVKAADFLTGHFPYEKTKPEVETVDGKLVKKVF
jgi:hypothetical protein